MVSLPSIAGKDPAFRRFVDALDGYLRVRFGCASGPVERPISGRCVSASGDSFSLYLRYRSGLYDGLYDRPVTLARMTCDDLCEQRNKLLRFLVEHADEYDLGTVILECADDEASRDAHLLGFKPCGTHFRNWHVPVQELKSILMRLD